MAEMGAGEILLTSMDRDGTKIGFDLELTRAVSDAVPVPVIASGGVGTLEHLSDGIRIGGADAVLAASIFHYGEFTGRPGQGPAGARRHSGAAVTRPHEVRIDRRPPQAQQVAGGRQAGAAPDARPRARDAVQLAGAGPERLALPGRLRRQRRAGLRGRLARRGRGAAAGARPRPGAQPALEPPAPAGRCARGCECSDALAWMARAPAGRIRPDLAGSAFRRGSGRARVAAGLRAGQGRWHDLPRGARPLAACRRGGCCTAPRPRRERALPVAAPRRAGRAATPRRRNLPACTGVRA
jgi:hypothetical protein